MNFYNGQFIFDYTKNAEYYMTNHPTISVLDFYTRFFWKEGEKVLDSQERS